MKRLIIGAIAALVCTGLVQAADIRLENDTDALAYYAVVSHANLPVEGAARSDALVGGFLANLASTPYLPSGAVEQRYPLPGNDSSLVIMFLVQGGWEFASIVLPKANALPKGNAYLGFSKAVMLKGTDAQVITARPLDVQVPKSIVRIDGRFIDWITVGDSLAAARDKPLVIWREASGIRSKIQLSEAFSKGKGGTDLEKVKLAADNQYLYFMVSSWSAMSRGLSFVIRVYPKASGVNPWSLEIPVRTAGGQVFLWDNTRSASIPVDCGDFNQIGLFLEARIRLDRLPQALQDAVLQDGSQLEIVSLFTDGSITEEWYYGSIPSAWGGKGGA